jgi:hypothetical protein
MKLIAMLFSGIVLLAHPLNGCAQVQTNRSSSVSTVRLFITSDKAVVSPGSVLVVHASITNASNDTIAFNDIGQPMYEFLISFVDAAGKNHDLRPKNAVHDFLRNTWISVLPHDSHEVDIRVPLDR